ncbi:MAG: DUF1640 domain-containing protein [Magnetococcales bacterium]|nr:DUF1640 domain-containing protein [Magnetococcales bacterium]
MSTTVDVAFAFDTHKFIKQMVATGFTEEQAEVQVRLLSEILHTQLSTKADVAKVDLHVLELKRDIAAIDAKVETVKTELQRDIAAMGVQVETVRTELKRDVAAMGVQVETVRTELKRDMKEMELRMVIKMGAMILASVGILIGYLRAFPMPVQIVQPLAQEMRPHSAPAAR